MQTVQRFFWGHLLAAIAAFASAFALTRNWLIALAVLFVGAVWFALQARGTRRAQNLLLYLLVLGGLVSYWAGAPAWLLLLGTVAALGAWDLDHFLLRLAAVEKVNMESGLGAQHLRRLLLVEGTGLLPGMFALVLQAKISFAWIALLVLLAIYGLSRLIFYVRKQAM